MKQIFDIRRKRRGDRDIKEERVAFLMAADGTEWQLTVEDKALTVRPVVEGDGAKPARVTVESDGTVRIWAAISHD